MSFIVYPAIDLREGHVVRLRQGDYDAETRYQDDPVALASSYAEAGARWLHLVDLDAARLGRFTQLALIERIRRATGLSIQAGGGVRADADVVALINAGVDRVVVGTVAVRDPRSVRQWLERFGAEAICVALDTRRRDDGRWVLPVAGWTRESGADLFEGLDAYRGSPLRHLLCTDIGRDGMLSGIDPTLYRALAERHPELAVQVSGGVAALTDISSARDTGAGGVVLGRSLLEGRFTLAEALAC